MYACVIGSDAIRGGTLEPTKQQWLLVSDNTVSKRDLGVESRDLTFHDMAEAIEARDLSVADNHTLEERGIFDDGETDDEFEKRDGNLEPRARRRKSRHRKSRKTRQRKSSKGKKKTASRTPVKLGSSRGYGPFQCVRLWLA